MRKLFNFGGNLPLLYKVISNIFMYGDYKPLIVTTIKYDNLLVGKNILITGGGSGIGLSIAKKCVELGANVVITGRKKDKLDRIVKEIGSPRLNMQVWDISDITKNEQHLNSTKVLLNGEIDILVNNAALVNDVPFPNVSEEIWDQIYSTNSKGLFFLTQSLCADWINQDKVGILKKVINISSQGGFVGATYPYRLTKWDVAGLTQGLGFKLAPHGIIVNGIAPGIIATDMQPAYMKRRNNVFYDKNPIGRFAMPEEIAELAIFLMSDSSNFIVGQTIVCDGGYSIK